LGQKYISTADHVKKKKIMARMGQGGKAFRRAKWFKGVGNSVLSSWESSPMEENIEPSVSLKAKIPTTNKGIHNQLSQKTVRVAKQKKLGRDQGYKRLQM